MTPRSVVCFFAHPDDETVLAGGIISLLAKQNVAVRIVCATRGEGGELGEPPLVQRQDQLGKLRENELRCAAQALGASVTILDYVDPVVGADEALFAFDADFDRLAKQFADLARRFHADVVLTHGGDGEYGHPAHKLVNRAVIHGVRYALPDALIYTVAATVPNIEDRLWNASEPAHLALDIRPWAAAKIAAMECHVTQHALFKRHKKLDHVRDALRTVESVRRQWPNSHGEPPDDPFASLLQNAGAWIPQG